MRLRVWLDHDDVILLHVSSGDAGFEEAKRRAQAIPLVRE
jgi:hypothetical protein